jgi:hypothetical protein
VWKNSSAAPVQQIWENHISIQYEPSICGQTSGAMLNCNRAGEVAMKEAVGGKGIAQGDYRIQALTY